MKLISKKLTGLVPVFLFGIACTNSTRAAEPLRALLITGGCCHDYEAQKKILTEGISARANVKWTIVHESDDGKDHEISIYTNANWAKGFDVVVHDECWGQVTNVEAFRPV